MKEAILPRMFYTSRWLNYMVELYSKEEGKTCHNRVLLVPVLAILVSVSNASRSSTALTEHVYAVFINSFSIEVTIARKL